MCFTLAKHCTGAPYDKRASSQTRGDRRGGHTWGQENVPSWTKQWHGKRQGWALALGGFRQWLDRLGFGGCAVAWQAAWQGVGPFRALALDGQWLGKLVASAWQARGKLVASGLFFGKRPFYHFGGGRNVHVFDVSGFGNPAQVPLV